MKNIMITIFFLALSLGFVLGAIFGLIISESDNISKRHDMEIRVAKSYQKGLEEGIKIRTKNDNRIYGDTLGNVPKTERRGDSIP